MPQTNTNTFELAEITNGSLDSIVTKALTINPKKRVLIVGLGGTGNDTLRLVKKSIYRRFDLSATEGKIPPNVQFLAIDTDRAALEGLPFGEQIQLTDPNIVNDLQNKETCLPDYFKSWVNPNLVAHNGNLGNTGAGATRQFGRYLLMKNYSRVCESLSQKITTLITCPGNNIDIIVLSGISGGTGSGTFIDMGYIIRKTCQDLLVDPYAQITAYLYLPDANLGNPNTPPDLQANIRANGYAALKDLDYFMSVDDKHRVSSNPDASKNYRFVQRYGPSNTDTIKSEKAPFDSTYLVSGQTDPLHISSNSYEYAQNITADNIFNFIAGTGKIEGHDLDDNANAGDAVMSSDINGAAMVAASEGFIRPDTNRRQVANYKYKVMGAGMATLPVNEINSYVCAVFLKKVNILKEQQPNAEDFNSFYRNINMNNLEAAVFGKIGAPRNMISGSVLKENSAAGKQQLIASLKRYKTDALSNMETFIGHEIGIFKNRIINDVNIIFQDIEKGPFFANKIMADGTHGVIQKLKELADMFKRREAAYDAQVKKLGADATAAWNEAENAHIGREKKYQLYVDTMVNYAVTDVKHSICGKLADEINGNITLNNRSSLVNDIREKNRGVYDVYTMLLDELCRKYNPDHIIATQGKNVFMWNIVSLEDIKADLSDKLDAQQIDKALNDMLVDMVNNSVEWCASKKTMHKLSKFLGDSFQNIFAQTMDSFLENIPPNQLTVQIGRLDENAKEHFPINIKAESNRMCGIADIITIPENCPNIQSSVKAYLDSKGKQIIPIESNIREKISWMRVSIGVPLFRYAYLQSCEQSYMSVPNIAGMHLYENPNNGICGRDYPELLPDFFYAHGHENAEAERKNAENLAVFEKAEALGLIGSDANAVHIKVTKTDWVKPLLKAAADKYGINLDNVSASVVGLTDILNCKAEISAIEMPADTEYENIYIPDTELNAANPDDQMKYARDMFVRMPEAVAAVKNELEKFNGIENAVKELEAMEAAFNSEKDTYMSFAYADIFGIIGRKGLKYVYDEGETQTELAMINMQMPWRYNAFGVFGENIAKTVKKDAEEKYNEAVSDNDKLKELVQNLDKMLKAVTAEHANLAYLDPNKEDEAKVIEFYNKLKMFIVNEYNALNVFF